MKRGKKYLWMILFVFLVGNLAGCSKNTVNTSGNNQGQKEVEGEATLKPEDATNEDSTSDESTDETVPSEEASDGTDASEDTTTEVPSITVPEFSVEKKEIAMNDALQFVQDMKIGWNLGNTLDASSDTNSSNELSYESSWSGAVTTQEMITAVKAAGFNTIRIPVSWHNHVEGENFTISEVWLNRVQEVVDYAVNEGMYIILNIHHDIAEGYYYPSEEQYETSSRYMSSIWTQVSERFADYDDHLIFEGINEPRLKGTNYEWWLDLNNDECKEAVDCINRLNQVFVDTVRATGGNNATRYLMVPGYCASPEFALIDQFVLPTDLDTNENKIIVSVHAYTPYNFALQAATDSASTSEFSIVDKKGTADIDNFMERLYTKFISNGTPIVIGEFGARDKSGNLQARTEFAAYYVAAARARGITCVWWDNNAYVGTGENFGLFERKSLTWKYPEISDALIRYSE